MDAVETVVNIDEVELVSDIMWSAGVEGIEERAESPTSVRLVAGVPSEHTDAVVAALEPRWSVTRGVMEVDKWLDAWRPWASAVRVNDRLVVQPPWVEPIALPGDTVISLDPGHAWGHGAHPSTLLVARELAAMDVLAGAAVLDIGCGSGLLAILAAMRGARPVVAIDIDTNAVAATLSNALVNGVDDRIDVSTTPIGIVASMNQKFDVVAANIGVRVLSDMANSISATVAPAGVLVLSGLLDEQVDAVVSAYPQMEEIVRTSLDGWSAVLLRHNAVSIVGGLDL